MSDDLSAKMTPSAIGLLVKGLRDKAGITTTELARRVGISQAQISRLENGKQGFRSSTLAKIASSRLCRAEQARGGDAEPNHALDEHLRSCEYQADTF